MISCKSLLHATTFCWEIVIAPFQNHTGVFPNELGTVIKGFKEDRNYVNFTYSTQRINCPESCTRAGVFCIFDAYISKVLPIWFECCFKFIWKESHHFPIVSTTGSFKEQRNTCAHMAFC